jgi:uncharacterized RDD family membrane protein YckC
MNAENPAGGPQSPAGPQSPGPQAPDPQAAPPPPQSPQAPAGAALATPAAGTPELSSVGKRFGAYCLDVVLAIVTLGIGWLIWALIILGRGQTPAKQILNMRVVDVETGQVPSWGMMFVRDFVLKGLVMSIVISITFGLGLILYFWLTWDDKNQELWDKIIGSVVVEDPDDRLAPA